MKPWQYITAGVVGGGLLVFALLTTSRNRALLQTPPPQPIALTDDYAPMDQNVLAGAGDAGDPAAAVGYTRGAESAPVQVVEFSDFGCPFCGSFARETYPKLHEEFVVSGKVRWTYVPFVMGMFPNGDEAALAAECAAEQGTDHFWTMHDLLYAEQRPWKQTREPAPLFKQYASQLRLDGKRFDACYRDQRRAPNIAASNRAAQRAGVRATPTFFVNGQRLEGALPLEHFRALLNQPGH